MSSTHDYILAESGDLSSITSAYPRKQSPRKRSGPSASASAHSLQSLRRAFLPLCASSNPVAVSQTAFLIGSPAEDIQMPLSLKQ